MTTQVAVNGVKAIIAIASGKGGVGKSTVAANLALALRDAGHRVAVLDADIYGPSVPLMLGADSKPESVDGKYLRPVMCHGIQTMSMGYLVDSDDTPMVWRGPMVSKALQQLLRETLWDDVDIMLLDLPPGTGDIQLTMAQKIPVTGAVIVTTPQDIALLDAKKALQMFRKVNVPVLGIIENMSTHVCSQCGHEEAIFGEHGGEHMAQHYKTQLLGSIPLAKDIRLAIDAGKPSVIADPNSASAQHFAASATALLAALNQANQRRAAFPKIVVEMKNKETE